MLNVLRGEMQHLVGVFLIILGIPMLNVSQSALSTLSVQGTRLASTITVKIHVQVSVVFMPLVMLQIMFLNVLVTLDIQEIHLSHVLVSQHVSYHLNLNLWMELNNHIFSLLFSCTSYWKNRSMQPITLWNQCCLSKQRKGCCMSMYPRLLWWPLCCLQTWMYNQCRMPIQQSMSKLALCWPMPSCQLWSQCSVSSGQSYSQLCLHTRIYWRPLHSMSPTSSRHRTSWSARSLQSQSLWTKQQSSKTDWRQMSLYLSPRYDWLTTQLQTRMYRQLWLFFWDCMHQQKMSRSLPWSLWKKCILQSQKSCPYLCL